MKSFDLNSYGVQEMSVQEMVNVDGGCYQFFWGVIAGSLAGELLFEGVSQCWKDFKSGFNSVSKIY